MSAITWIEHTQQVEHIKGAFDVVHVGVVTITRDDIDLVTSQRVGQNRLEEALDAENIERMGAYAAAGVSMPRPIVWRQEPTDSRVVVLDGRHRIEMAFEQMKVDSIEVDLFVGAEFVATQIARTANVMHGRSAMDPTYVAATMRTQREQGVTLAELARMWGFSESRIGVLTRRDEQAERLERLLPGHKTVKVSALDMAANLEDDHLVELGATFLDAPKAEQVAVVEKLKSTPSAERAGEVKRLRGYLEAKAVDSRKTRARTSTATATFQSALTRLASVADPVGAFYGATRAQQAKMADQIATAMPHLERLQASFVREVA